MVEIKCDCGNIEYDVEMIYINNYGVMSCSSCGMFCPHCGEIIPEHYYLSLTNKCIMCDEEF